MDAPTERHLRLTAAELGQPMGERATLVQFSTAFCAPCRATRQALGSVAALVPGVHHIEVDAESHLELVRRVGVVQTPTTVIVDAEGRLRRRAAGAARRATVLFVLETVLRESEPEQPCLMSAEDSASL